METFDFVGISVVVGVLLPYLTSFIKNIGRSWPAIWVKVMAFALAGVSALIVVGAQEGWTSLSVSMILGSFAVIYPLAQVTYNGLIGGTKVEQVLASALNKG